jgi:hypothetical protein
MQRSVEKILKGVEGRKFKWAYLGDNVSRAITIERLIGDKGERLQIAGKLQESAHSVRLPYINLIGDLSIKRNSILWWAGAISEKNPYDKLFLNCCYMRVAEQLLGESHNRNLVLFVESTALRKALQRSAHRKGCKVKDLEMFWFKSIESLKGISMFFIRRVFFISSGWKRYLIMKRYRYVHNFMNDKTGKPLVLIHTAIDQRSFGSDGTYRDSYFGHFSEYLRERGDSVIIVPYVLFPYSSWATSFAGALERMKDSGEQFLIPDLFLRPVDYIRAAYNSLYSLRSLGRIELSGIDISDLMNEKKWQDFIGTNIAHNLLFYYLVKRWREIGVKIDRLIYLYENQSWEKMFCYAMKQFYPDAKIIGYQHSAISEMMLNYFPSKIERDIIPTPDVIVCNGVKPKEQLKQYGYYKDKLKAGPAIRYVYLHDLLRANEDKQHRKFEPDKVILISLSIGSEAIELCLKIIEAFKNDKRKVVIKPHPISPIEFFLKKQNIKLPQNIEIRNSPISELLPYSKVLIYTSSTTCFEALAYHIPVIHVRSDYVIDMNRLEDYPEAFFVANTPREIRETVERVDTYSKNNNIFESIVKENFSDPKTTDWKVFTASSPF